MTSHASRARHLLVKRSDDSPDKAARRARPAPSCDRAPRSCGPSCGSVVKKALGIEWPVQPHFQHADLFAVRAESIDRLVRRFAARAHHHDHALGIGRAVIFEQAVAAGR